MGVTKVQNSDYKITRYSFWKFWKIDELEINLPTRYSDAYHEVEKKSPNGTSYSIELESWVIEDVREQLYNKVHKYQKLVNRSKKLRDASCPYVGGWEDNEFEDYYNETFKNTEQ